VDSIYQRMRNRNRCNHRDYQNLSVDGARSPSMNRTIVESIARDQTNDFPVNAFYALVGNDVCNGHPGYDSMTKPDEFYGLVTATMQFLDQSIPMGSHVFFIGLDNGEVIYDVMHNQTHPLFGVTYERLWMWVGCLLISPCWGWLNSDPEARNRTCQRANELNEQFPKIIASQKYKHFDMHYLGNFLEQNVKTWKSQGGDPSELFEIVGGGHPSQLDQELTAAAIWNVMVSEYPETIGAVNPNNAKIQKLFGDQGGY